MQSLFPAQPASSQQASCQFKAGKCHLTKQTNGKYQVTADKRKGQVSLVRGSDGLLHFKWSNLANGAVEDDQIVMPGEGNFKKVKTGRDTPSDRVYMLKIPGVEVPFMYWLQDIDGSKDGDIIRDVNNALNNTNNGAQNANVANAPWMQLLGNQGGTTRVPATPAAASSSGANTSTNIGGLDFASLLTAFGVNNNQQQGASAAPPVSFSTPAPANSTAHAIGSPTPQHGGSALSIDDIRRAMEGKPATPSLSDVLNAEEILRTGILNDPAVQQELLATLPPEHQTAEALEATLRSAQLQQATQSFSHALQQTENFQSIMSNFQIDPTPGISHLNHGDGVGAFLSALQAANPPQPASSTTSSENNSSAAEEKKDNDDRMEE